MRSKSHSLHSLSKYTAITDDNSICADVCSLVECMERVSCWPETNRKYVCIAACVLELGGVIGVRCGMRA